MTVVTFPRLPARTLEGGWRAAEVTQFINACAAYFPNGQVSGWEAGTTEYGDPQLYLIGPEPDYDCILCISRLGQVYILEDGTGRVIFEHENLVRFAEQAGAALRTRKQAILAQIAVAWCAAREFYEDRVEPVIAEPLELLTHLSPQLAALA
jgi:hypothetical protein